MSLLTQGAENGSLTINVNDKVLKAISVQEVEDFLNARYGTSNYWVYIKVTYEITVKNYNYITLKLNYCRDMTWSWQIEDSQKAKIKHLRIQISTIV